MYETLNQCDNAKNEIACLHSDVLAYTVSLRISYAKFY